MYELVDGMTKNKATPSVLSRYHWQPLPDMLMKLKKSDIVDEDESEQSHQDAP
jgi:hypothetical protein